MVEMTTGGVVIPNAERDLIVMAMERQGKEMKRREISPDGRDDNGGSGHPERREGSHRDGDGASGQKK